MSLNFSTPPASAESQTPLQNLATSPQRVRTDEGTVEERPLPEVLQADVYNRLDAAASAVRLPLWGIAVASVRPPDALGRQAPDPFAPRML